MLLNGQTRKSIEGKEFGNGSSLSDIKAAYNEAIDYVNAKAIGTAKTQASANSLKDILLDYNDLDNTDIAGQIARTEENIKKLQELQKQQNEIPENERASD